MSSKSIWANTVGAETGGDITGENLSGKRALHVVLPSSQTPDTSRPITFSVTPRGAYDATITYNVGDLVLHLSITYIAITQTLGNLPTLPEFWQVVAPIT